MKNTHKKQRYVASHSFLFIVISILVLIVAAEIVIAIIFLNAENWIAVLTSVTEAVITAILVTATIGTFVKMITEKYFLVRKNDKLLKACGVLSVGTGESSHKDLTDVFGDPTFNSFPQEIHMIFITGSSYISDFRDRLIKSIEHGCDVKILVMSVEPDNLDYVSRIEDVYKKEHGYFANEIKKVKSLIDGIRSELKDNGCTGKIELRFYKSEYYYNFRSSKYYDGKKGTYIHKNIVNVQPFNTPAAARGSIALSGTFTDSENNENNIFYHNDETFKTLWEKYENV